MKNNIEGIIFFLNVVYIFTSELFIYFFMRDYSIFIDRLTIRLSSVNMLCVKIFQAIASNNSLIDSETNEKLMKFTDNAPWDFSDVNLKELIDVTEKYNIVLKQGYEIPINSGMISLVFKGYKKDNLIEPVIIKMKRKDIEIKLNDAIQKLLFFVYILSFFPLINNYQINELVNKNIDIIRHQTNFMEEIDNMELIRNNCRNLKYVKIPTANREVTREYPNIIIMDFINGVKINNVSQEDYYGFAKQVVKFGVVTTIIHGVTHGDLHGGNILFIKDRKDEKYPHKIGVIDFGIIYKLKSDFKGLLFNILTQIFEVSPRESAEKIINAGIIEPEGILQQIPKKDYENILKFSEEIIRETITSSENANQVQIYRFLSKLKEYLSNSELKELGIRPSSNFVKSQLVLTMAHGVTLTLCNGDFVGLMDVVLNELFHTNMIL